MSILCQEIPVIRGKHVTRYWSKVTYGTGCWLWKGKPRNGKYGYFQYKYRSYPAHRISYQLKVNRLKVDELVLHKCHNMLCVNPAHLYVGTQKDNVRDMLLAKRGHYQRRTHCPHGHEYSAVNTQMVNGKRYCKECKKRYRPKPKGLRHARSI